MLTAGERFSRRLGNRLPGTWARVLVTLLILLYLLVHVVILLPGIGKEQSDFSTFYYPAARAVLAGQSPYSVVGLVYPPLLPFILLPLALFPVAWARLAWFALSHAFAVAAGVRMWQALGRDWRAAFVITGAWAMSGALFEDLREGQVNTLLLLLIVVALWPRAGKPRCGPVALGVAIAVKLWPAVMLFADALRSRWRNILRACAVALVLVVLPWLFGAVALSGPPTPQRADIWAGSPGALNGSLPGVALRLLDPPERGAPIPEQWVAAHNVETFRATHLQTAVSLGVAAMVFVLGVAALARGTRVATEPHSGQLASAAFIALALVAAPVVWPHYYVLELPGVAMLGTRFIRRAAWVRLVVLGGASLVSTWAMPLIMGPYLAHFGLTVVHPLLLWTLTSMTPAGGLAVLVLLVAELNRDILRQDPRRQGVDGQLSF